MKIASRCHLQLNKQRKSGNLQNCSSNFSSAHLEAEVARKPNELSSEQGQVQRRNSYVDCLFFGQAWEEYEVAISLEENSQSSANS
jgi:hypothetical protein